MLAALLLGTAPVAAQVILSGTSAVSEDGKVVFYGTNTPFYGGTPTEPVELGRWTAATQGCPLGSFAPGTYIDFAAITPDGSSALGTAFNYSNGSTKSQAFRWTAAGLDTTIGLAGFSSHEFGGCNADRTVLCGRSWNATWKGDANDRSKAFRFVAGAGSGGTVTDLGVLPGDTDADTYGGETISSDGTAIVAQSWSAVTGQKRLFRWKLPASGAPVRTPIMELQAAGGFIGGPATFLIKSMTPDGATIIGDVSRWNAADMQTRSKVWRWNETTGLNDSIGIASLQNHSACGASKDGKVVAGWSATGDMFGTNPRQSRAFRWDATSGLTSDIGTLSGDTDADLYGGAVSGDGNVIVGVSWNSVTQQARVFRWKRNATGSLGQMSTIASIGSIASQSPSLRVRFINQDGSVIVGSHSAGSTKTAWRWTPSGTTLVKGLATHTSHDPEAVNTDGTIIVGTSDGTVAGVRQYRGFRWSALTGTSVPLGPLTGDTDSEVDAYGGGDAASILSASGEVLVAQSWKGESNPARLFVWSSGAITPMQRGTPTISSVSPAGGPPSGGTTITISGSNLLGATVKVGGVAATAVVATSNTITAKTPAGVLGPRDVSVTTSAGTATKPAGFTYALAPALLTVSPANGSQAGGTSITVTGSNFISGSTTLTVGGVAATNVSVISATSLTATTPPGTIGPKDVVVTTPGGSSTKTAGFSYIVAPTIATVTPASGPVSGGTTITVTGSNFIAGATTVSVGGVPATAVSVSGSGSLSAKTPVGTLGAKPVVVTTAGGSASRPNAFTYLPAPAIVSVSPDFGPQAGGTVITVTGSNFVVGATAVQVGGVPATNVVVNSTTSLAATTPAGPAGPRDVTVVTPGGSAVKVGAFTAVAAPEIDSVSPVFGPTTGGTLVTVTGANFRAGGTAVSIGGVAATSISVASSSLLTAKVPAGGAGPKTIAVTTIGGTTSEPGAFTYVAPPTITAITPATGPQAGGTAVTITGTNFLIGATFVGFGGVPATNVVVTSATSLTATTPAAFAPGARDVAVSTAGGSATKVAAYSYVAAPPPTITSVSPGVGPISGGTTIAVSGSNFLPGALVTVGGVPATAVSVNGPSSLTATTPPGLAGPKHVMVTTVAGSVTKFGAFTYVAAPTITTVTPNTGPTSGGTSITISGTNLSGATVTVGGAAATSVVATATTIMAKTPAGTAGSKSVMVVTAGGSVTHASAFTYVSSLTGGGPGGMPAGGTRGGADGPSDTPPPDDTGVLPVTMERCIELIQRSTAPAADCAATSCGDLSVFSLDPVEDGPTGPDLDGNGVPDLCQLRCGDFDMDGHVGMGDVAMLLAMFGEPPTLGIGDLDADGEIGAADMMQLLRRCRENDAHADASEHSEADGSGRGTIR